MNTIKTQAKTNKMITAYLSLNNIKAMDLKSNGVLIGKVLLTSIQDAKIFVKHVESFKA